MDNEQEKKNRAALRRLMGSYDVDNQYVSAVLGVGVGTVNNWRSISGACIDDHKLFYLKEKLKEQFPAGEDSL